MSKWLKLINTCSVALKNMQKELPAFEERTYLFWTSRHDVVTGFIVVTHAYYYCESWLMPKVTWACTQDHLLLMSQSSGPQHMCRCNQVLSSETPSQEKEKHIWKISTGPRPFCHPESNICPGKGCLHVRVKMIYADLLRDAVWMICLWATKYLKKNYKAWHLS